MINKIDNVVLNLNALQQGLNFLVPSEWWNDFLRLNEKIKKCEDIVIPASHPLDVLIEMGIIKYQEDSFQQQIVSLRDNARKAAQMVRNQVLHMLTAKSHKNKADEECSAISEWASLDIESAQDVTKMLICLQIDFDLMREILFDPIQWKVVKPSLYRLINQNNSVKKGYKYSAHIIGLPIFLDNLDVLDCKTEMSYQIQRQILASIYLYNTNGNIYYIIGAVETKITLPQMLQYLYEGIKNIATEQYFDILNNSKRKIVSLYRNAIYSNQKQIDIGLPWRPYRQLPKNVYTPKFEIVQFSSDSLGQQNEGDDELFKNNYPSKKRKENEIDLDKRNKKRGFQPASNNQSYSPISKISYNYSAIEPIIQINSSINKSQQTNEHHSSTEQQTPSAKLRENSLHTLLHADYIKYHHLRIEENRIKFPIWGSNMNVKSLLKFSELKTNDFIGLPFSPSARLCGKSKSSKRVFLSGKCNVINQNEYGQAIEEEAVSVQPQVFTIPKEVMKNLQNLAILVVNNKPTGSTEKLVRKQELPQAAKQKGDIESQTCKNQDMDEQESIQSHLL